MKYIAITLVLTCIGIIITPYVQMAWRWIWTGMTHAYELEDNEQETGDKTDETS